MTCKIKIEDIKKENISYIENLCEENNCKLYSEWKSKYNSYIVYDCEPHCTVGFGLNVYIESEYFCNAKFVEYLYSRRIEKVDKLNKIFKEEIME